MSSLNILIMAAGLGTRMKSEQAKVLHRLAGVPMIGHVYRIANELAPARIMVVVGYQAEAVQSAVTTTGARLQARGLAVAPTSFVLQAEQRGTGHAVMQAQPELANLEGTLVVLSGDVPLIQLSTLQALVQQHQAGQFVATALTTLLPDPTGYGRIVRDAQGNLERIVEHRDASPAIREINEINAGIYCFEIQPLLGALGQLSTNNAQGEYYLTDVLGILGQAGQKVGLVQHAVVEDVLGINTRNELAACELRLRRQKLERLMQEGVTIIDPASTYIAPEVVIGPDTIIHPQVIIEGETRIGTHCEIHSWSHLTDAQLGDRVTIKNCCVVVESRLHNNVSIGPFAHLRMQAELNEDAVVGNFVEVKKSSIGRETKAMHLTYLGDATIGERTNIGAGTITCNYDGKRKNPTYIGNNVKIGSDTMLIAPVRVGDGAVTGAGSVVTKDIPAGALAVGVPARVRERTEE